MSKLFRENDSLREMISEQADEIERLQTELKRANAVWALGREIIISDEGMDFKYKTPEEALAALETGQGESDGC